MERERGREGKSERESDRERDGFLVMKEEVTQKERNGRQV